MSLSGTGRRVQVAEPAAGADGTLAVTWESRLPTTAGYYTSARTLAAIRPPGGAWGTQSLLSDPDIEGRGPHVGVGPDGTTTVVWESYDGANDKVATRVHRGGSWEPQNDLTQSVDSESDPQLAIGAGRHRRRGVLGTSRRAPASRSALRAALGGRRTSSPPRRRPGTTARRGRWRHRRGPVDLRQRLRAAGGRGRPPAAAPAAPAAAASAETGPITGPAKIEKGKKASYSFTGTPASVTFQCRVDETRHQQTGAKGKKGKKPVPWRTCQSPVKVKTKKLKPGQHTLYVRAVLAGVPDPTPSSKRFKVTRDRVVSVSGRGRAAPAGWPAGRASR